jgi:hypothetical protein
VSQTLEHGLDKVRLGRSAVLGPTPQPELLEALLRFSSCVRTQPRAERPLDATLGVAALRDEKCVVTLRIATPQVDAAKRRICKFAGFVLDKASVDADRKLDALGVLERDGERASVW